MHRRPFQLCFLTKLFLAVFLFFIVHSLWTYGRTAHGREILYTIVTSAFSSLDFYLAFLLIVFNGLLYALIIRHVYSDTSKTLQGITRGLYLLMGPEGPNKDSDGTELDHFFMVFVLPFVFIAAGWGEFYALKAWIEGTW